MSALSPQARTTRRHLCLATAALLATMVAADPAVARNAMSLSPDGHGQVLIYPYYTVNGGNLTLLTIENTRDEAKAVRVRFREALNGRVVLQLSLYLGPQDMWTAAITPAAGIGAATGPARLYTGDTSCTLPRVTVDGLPFTTRDYIDNTATGGPNRQDHPSSLQATHSVPERTRSGSIEVIEMGVLRPGHATTQLAEEVTAQAPADPLVEPAQPADCNAVARAWQAGRGGWADLGGARDVGLPTGGLAGTAAIVDVADGTLMGYRAEAVAGFYTDVAAPGALHHAPDAAEPDLGDCNHGNGRCHVLYPATTGPSHRLVFAAGDARGWDAFSSLFMSLGLFAEHLTEVGIAGRTEWAVGYPTRQFYVDRSPPERARPPFEGNPFLVAGRSCAVLSPVYYNRESLQTSPPVNVIPGPPGPPPPQFCYQSSLATFNETQARGPVLGQASVFAQNFSTTWFAGVVNDPGMAPQLANGYAWLRPVGTVGSPVIDVDNEQTFGTAQRYGRIPGLPMAGIAFRTAINANAQPGLLARYGAAWGASRLRFMQPPFQPPPEVKDTSP